MPCHDDRLETVPHSETHAAEINKITAQITAQYQERVDMLARMACSACRQLQAHGVEIPPDVLTWWKRHQLLDDVGKAFDDAMLKAVLDATADATKLRRYDATKE